MKGLINALLAVKPIDCIIVGLAVAIVVGVTILAIVRKKQGKSITCDCSSCEGCSGCSRKQEK